MSVIAPDGPIGAGSYVPGDPWSELAIRGWASPAVGRVDRMSNVNRGG
jgi:hypothetical protein